MLENGTIIGNRYEILGKIGSGGTADVYKAKCHKLNRYVAIKVLKSEFSEDRNFINKFRIEAQSAAGMAHANIVNVYDVGDENGIYYIVMELVEGITLKQYIDNKGALGYKEAVSIAIQIAQGIEVAHKHNIIHRDIKPQNIIISREGKVKVTDFGIAKVTNADTVNSMAMGSVHYISPEQARGGFSDATSDIYSFGITLYEMCTGRVPFDGDSTVAVALMHIQNELVPPTVYNPAIPVSVEQIILKCTQKRMEKRYQSATELIADLKRALITPNENFVTLSQEVDTSPTVMFTPEEMSQINAKRNTNPGIDYAQINAQAAARSNYGVTGDSIDLQTIYDDDDEYDEASEDEYEKHIGLDDAEDEYTGDSNKIDKIMTWFGVGVAVVIVAVTFAVVLRVMSTINKPGTNITASSSQSQVVTVSGDEGVAVPYVVGYTSDEAKKLLNQSSLGYGEEKESSDIFPSGTVIRQSVDEGTRVAANTKIICTVSTGAGLVDMVDVVNYTEEMAVETLKLAGFNPVVEYEYSSTVDQGIVIKTSPDAQTKTMSGADVTVTVSRGKQEVQKEVPRILGLDESSAREALDKLGFVAQNAGSVASATVPKGSVVAQSYPEGTVLASGSIVEYVLSSGSSNLKYKGSVELQKGWFTSAASNAIENNELPGYNGGELKIEAQAVLHQSTDIQDYTKEIMSSIDINSLGESFVIDFDGIVDGVSTGEVDFLITYTWVDSSTGESKQVGPKNVQAIAVTLTGAN
jgi:serine/threonine-protein kinase